MKKEATATVKLQPQERTGEYLFNGQIVMTVNFQNIFGDRCFYIILESLAQIRALILKGGADYFQALSYNETRYWCLQDSPKSGELITFLMPSDY